MKETVILCLEYFLGREKFEEIFVKVVLLLKECSYFLQNEQRRTKNEKKKM